MGDSDSARSLRAVPQIGRPTVNQELVAVLEDHLEQARAGKLQGCAYWLLWDDEAGQTGWALPESHHPTLVVGGIATLQHRYWLHVEEDR